MDDLKQRLRSYDPAYMGLLDDAIPFLESGRAIDLEHTLDVLTVLLDFMDKDEKAAADHDILIPAALLHDCGWAEVPKDVLSTSYGDVRPDNPGKIIHQERGAAIARTLLGKYGRPRELIERVAAIITIHDIPKEYVKDNHARIVAEADKLVRYMPGLFWSLIKDGRMTYEQRIRFLEAGIQEWFSIAEFRERARRLIEDRKRDGEKRLPH